MKNVAYGSAVSYRPYLLKSMAEICKQFGVGRKQVREWIRAGAPVAVEGHGAKAKYSAELLRLQLWREEKSDASSRNGGDDD